VFRFARKRVPNPIHIQLPLSLSEWIIQQVS
jgi:hypothetical protein